MKKELLEILYNPGSISTAGTGKNSENLTDAVIMTEASVNHSGLNELDYELLDNLEKLIQAHTEAEVIAGLINFKHILLLGGSLEVRPLMLKEFNNYLRRAVEKFTRSPEIFQRSVEVILEFKRQMDKQNQNRGYLSQTEWVELERSVYTLNVWEENINNRQQEFLFSPI